MEKNCPQPLWFVSNCSLKRRYYRRAAGVIVLDDRGAAVNVHLGGSRLQAGKREDHPVRGAVLQLVPLSLIPYRGTGQDGRVFDLGGVFMPAAVKGGEGQHNGLRRLFAQVSAAISRSILVKLFSPSVVSPPEAHPARRVRPDNRSSISSFLIRFNPFCREYL